MERNNWHTNWTSFLKIGFSTPKSLHRPHEANYLSMSMHKLNIISSHFSTEMKERAFANKLSKFKSFSQKPKRLFLS